MGELSCFNASCDRSTFIGNGHAFTDSYLELARILICVFTDTATVTLTRCEALKHATKLALVQRRCYSRINCQYA